MEQRTEEWFAARLGRVTASRIADVVAKTKTGYGAGRANYMAELVCERLTGQRAEGFTSKAMQHGTDTEPRAACPRGHSTRSNTPPPAAPPSTVSWTPTDQTCW